MTGNTSFPIAWGVKSARQIADTAVGTVYEVILGDGLLAIAKYLKPKALEDSQRGADFIIWRNGTGCVRLLDRTQNILLMEHAGTETLRDVLIRQGMMPQRTSLSTSFSSITLNPSLHLPVPCSLYRVTSKACLFERNRIEKMALTAYMSKQPRLVRN